MSRDWKMGKGYGLEASGKIGSIAGIADDILKTVDGQDASEIILALSYAMTMVARQSFAGDLDYAIEVIRMADIAAIGVIEMFKGEKECE